MKLGILIFCIVATNILGQDQCISEYQKRSFWNMPFKILKIEKACGYKTLSIGNSNLNGIISGGYLYNFFFFNLGFNDFYWSLKNDQFSKEISPFISASLFKEIINGISGKIGGGIEFPFGKNEDEWDAEKVNYLGGINIGHHFYDVILSQNLSVVHPFHAHIEELEIRYGIDLTLIFPKVNY